jgi:hypothetical protein
MISVPVDANNTLYQPLQLGQGLKSNSGDFLFLSKLCQQFQILGFS